MAHVLGVFLLSICICLVFACNAAKADLVDDICSKSLLDIQYCNQTLRAAPGSNTTDLSSLGQITINLAKSQVQPIQALINKIEGGATNQTLKDKLDKCREDFTDVEGDVDGFSDLLSNKDYAGLVNSVDSADDKATGCDTAFDDGQPPEPDELKQASKHFQVLLEAVGNIAETLEGQKL